MRADNTEALRATARRRSDETLTRARVTIEALAASSEAVTVAAVARHPRVSRSWLYTRPDLLERINTIGRKHPPTQRRGDLPPSQHASGTSLQRRLELAHQRIGQLSEDNRRLRGSVASARGHGPRSDGPIWRTCLSSCVQSVDPTS
jgi:hypothetical protein